MKLIALLLTLCLSFNVLAESGTLQEFERHIDDYQFAMTVEWDQKDQAFYESQTNLFMEKIGKLITEQGLSKKEISALIEKKVPNKKVLEALQLKIKLMGDKQSSTEMVKVLKENSKELYAQGASWNGEVTGTLMGILLVIAILVVASDYECVEWGEKWVCEGQSYDDGSYYESCGWERVCTRYQEKK